MKTIATTLLAVLLAAGVGTGAFAQPGSSPAHPEMRPDSPPADTSITDERTTPPRLEDRRDDPAASPRTVERAHILGVRASTAIFVAAAILFVIVLVATILSREEQSYRRSDIDPRR